MDSFSGLDKRCYNDKSAVRRALISEVAADDTYAEMLELSQDPNVLAVVREIQKDEQNHQGRLLSLLTKLEGGDDSSFSRQVSAGLLGQEISE